MVDRMLTHPLLERRLRTFDAFLKRDLRCHVAIGHDFLDVTTRCDATKVAEHGNDGHEHATGKPGLYVTGYSIYTAYSREARLGGEQLYIDNATARATGRA
jgi:hypothetical protein